MTANSGSVKGKNKCSVPDATFKPFNIVLVIQFPTRVLPTHARCRTRPPSDCQRHRTRCSNLRNVPVATAAGHCISNLLITVVAHSHIYIYNYIYICDLRQAHNTYVYISDHLDTLPAFIVRLHAVTQSPLLVISDMKINVYIHVFTHCQNK